MINHNSPAPKRIPVRFVDEEGNAERAHAAPEQADEDNTPTADELGRASIYEGETEMQRRIDRGEEGDSEQGKADADDRDTAGAPPRTDMPEERDEQDTQRPMQAEEARGGGERANARRPNARGGSSAGNSALAMQAELFAAQAELEMVEAELQKARAERQELQDLAARRQADFDNYRKRIERERGETYNRVVAEVIGKLLPVMDNLRRAHEAESSVEATESQEFRNFLHGVELISKQLNGVLESLGVEPVPTVGHRFDPHIHEAIVTEQTDEFEPDTVMQEIVRGYRIGEKLLRPAMVKVATK
ncbi:MAG TPA: nucleotide exchange factor GrpE [Pyrinomonadaceae bacterium]|nr:nucleotide exchange factor GrpE [Pyrinomonadaceae bacterium]